MEKIRNIKVIQHFYNKPMDTIRAIYDCEVCSEQTVLVRKDDDVYAIQHLSDKPELLRVRTDVRDELFSKLEKLL